VTTHGAPVPDASYVTAGHHDGGPRRDTLARRLLVYQSIRFPLAAYSVLVVALVAASATYSRALRGLTGTVTLPLLFTGSVTTLVFFFMLRVLDEHKDREVDARYRPELPVPSGLIRLSELRWVGGFVTGSALLLNGWMAPRLLLAFALVALWAALMTGEFFVPRWLRAHPTAYLLSHMAIMPAIDVYTTGLDWLAAGVAPPAKLLPFLAVTFLNGILIEIGRKLRATDGERAGVDTYTKAWGLRLAPVVWLAALAGATVCALVAASFTHVLASTAAILIPLAIVASVPCVGFLRAPTSAAAARTERASQLWPLGTYLVLGAAPSVQRALQHALA